MNRRQLLRLGALAVAAPKAMVASPPALPAGWKTFRCADWGSNTPLKPGMTWRIVNLAELGLGTGVINLVVARVGAPG